MVNPASIHLYLIGMIATLILISNLTIWIWLISYEFQVLFVTFYIFLGSCNSLQTMIALQRISWVEYYELMQHNGTEENLSVRWVINKYSTGFQKLRSKSIANYKLITNRFDNRYLISEGTVSQNPITILALKWQMQRHFPIQWRPR